MKNYTAICFFLAVAMILCPLVAVPKAAETFSANVSGVKVEESEFFEAAGEGTSESVKVLTASSGNITELPLREYLIGSVAGEIGAAFEDEAIKAQAVACHTLLLYKKTHKDFSGDADITDTNQKLLTEEEQREKWGEHYSEYRQKLERCVDAIIDKVICFDGEPIMATFYAISNGKTENSENVWGKSLPYLTSVESPDDKLASEYISSVSFTADEFKKILTENGASPSGENAELIGETVLNSTGTVKSITLGGKNFSGTQVRSAFSLRSATFSLKYENEAFTFIVWGYGHGVGMSQYGANAMAKNGNTYDEILLHYYKNAVISTVD